MLRRGLGLGLLLVLAVVSAAIPPGEVTVATSSYLPVPNFRAQTNLVTVDVVVRDRDGNPVGNLTQDAFQLEDDRQPQTLTSFTVVHGTAAAAAAPPAPAANAPTATSAVGAPAPAAPRAVALYFDDLHTQSGEMERARTAAQHFIVQGLGPGDLVAVYTGSNTVTLPFTADRDAVIAALAQLRSRPRMELNGNPGCPNISPDQAYQIVERLDPNAERMAVAEAVACNCKKMGDTSPSCPRAQARIVEAMAQDLWQQTLQQSEVTFDTLRLAILNLGRQPGAKTLLITSAGFLDGTLDAAEKQIVESAIHAGIVIDSLDAKGLVADAAESRPGGLGSYADSVERDDDYRAANTGRYLATYTAAMLTLASGTGGRLFWNNNDLASGYSELASPPAVSYLLGFTPTPFVPDGSFHSLAVTVNAPPPVTVQARKGYFAAASAPPPAPSDDLRPAVLADDTRTDFPMQVGAEPGAALRIATHIDVSGLQFGREADRNTQQLTFVAVLFGAKGPIVGKKAVMTMRLSDASLAELRQSGINATMTLAAPVGQYRLREVVADADGKLAAVSEPVSVR